MTRIRVIHAVMGQLAGIGLVDWIEGFQRDQFPEREVAIWEHIARAFETFTHGRSLKPEGRREAYKLLLASSMGSIEEVVTGLRHLTIGEAEEVLSSYLEAAV